MRLRLFVVSFAAILAACNRPETTAPKQTPPTVLAGYYIGEMPVANIPVGQLTDIIYAFGEPGKGNICHAPDSHAQAQFKNLRALRAAHPQVHLLLSIGGWGGAPQYSDAALTPRSRRAFAQSCIYQYVLQAGFDGLDVDWEFPVHGGVAGNPQRRQDKADVTALLAELRRQLDKLERSNHRHYYLTAATPTGRWQTGGAYDPSDSYDFPAIVKYVDWLNVMTYDMNNGDSPVSNFNAPMHADPHDPTPALERRWNNVSGAVTYYEQHGIPADKIVLGMPFYGLGYVGVSSKDHGRFSHYKIDYPETPYSVVRAKLLTDPAWQKHWSESAAAPWIYNVRTHTFFSYDDPRSMAVKAAFVKSRHLRGAMFWVLGEDDADGSLLRALSRVLLASPDTTPFH
jgi:chitinase